MFYKKTFPNCSPTNAFDQEGLPGQPGNPQKKYFQPCSIQHTLCRTNVVRINQLLPEKLCINVPHSIQNIGCGMSKTQQFPFDPQLRIKRLLQLQIQSFVTNNTANTNPLTEFPGQILFSETLKTKTFGEVGTEMKTPYV